MIWREATMDFMDFKDGCKVFFDKVAIQKALSDAKRLYGNGELEKAKKKLLSISSHEMSKNADASYLMAKIYLDSVGDKTRVDISQAVRKNAAGYLIKAISLKHKEARELYYQNFDGYGRIKSQKPKDHVGDYKCDVDPIDECKELADIRRKYFDEYINELNSRYTRHPFSKGNEMTDSTLERVHRLFPSVKKDDVIFYRDYSTVMSESWFVVCMNHYFDSNGEHGNILDIVKVKEVLISMLEGRELILFHENGKTSIPAVLREEEEFKKLANVIKNYGEHVKKHGKNFFDKKQYAKAFPYLLESAATYNESSAQSKIASCYKYGYHVKKDPQKTAYWENLSAENKNLNEQSKDSTLENLSTENKNLKEQPKASTEKKDTVYAIPKCRYYSKQFYAVLYNGYHYNKYEYHEQYKLWEIIRKLGNEVNIKFKDEVLGIKLLNKLNKNLILFTKEFAVYVLGRNKTLIHYDTLKKVTYDSKTITVHQFDGNMYSFEHSNKETFRIVNMLNRFAGIVHEDALAVDGKTMITHENADFHFAKFTSVKELPEDMESFEKMYLGYKSMPTDDPYCIEDAKDTVIKYYECAADKRNPAFITHKNVDYKFKKYVLGNVPGNFESLEKMYLGYTSMPADHPDQIGEKALKEITEKMLRSDLNDKYLQMQSDYGLVSAKFKLLAKRIDGYKNLSSIVSEIWYEIINDYQNEVKEPVVKELRLSEGNSFYNQFFWFEFVMNTLKKRAEKEIQSGDKPVAYAAYQAFNPSLSQLEKSRFATFEGQPVSEVLGKSPSAADVMKLFNISTYDFYRALKKESPYAWLFAVSLADIQETTVKTQYLPLSSVVEDYSLDDLKYMANTKRYMEFEQKTTGKVSTNDPGVDMIRQFNEDRKIETVKKGKAYSSFGSKCSYGVISQMSYIDYGIKYQTSVHPTYLPGITEREIAKLNAAKTYLSFYEKMSEAGDLVFTCFLGEKGEKDEEQRICERRDQQYAQLRKELDLIYNIKKQ